MSWNDGQPLEPASHRFGPREVAQRYAQLEKSHPTADSLATLMGKAIAAFDSPADQPSPLDSGEMSELSKVASEKSKLLQTLQSRLVQQLIFGHVVGYGYEMPRQASAKPVRIPNDVWTGTIKWGISSVKGNGLEFIQVRVCRAEKVELHSPPAEPSVKRGRPSRADQITEAFWSLDEDGEIPDTVENVKALFTPILMRIDRLNPDQAGDRVGLSKQTLYARVPKLIKEKTFRSQ